MRRLSWKKNLKKKEGKRGDPHSDLARNWEKVPTSRPFMKKKSMANSGVQGGEAGRGSYSY